MAIVLAVYHPCRPALDARSVVVNGRVKRLGLLQARRAYGCLQIIAGKKACATLGAFLAVHLALWLPAVEKSHGALLHRTE